MSRRPATPPPSDRPAYLDKLGNSGFQSVRQPGSGEDGSYEDDGTYMPSEDQQHYYQPQQGSSRSLEPPPAPAPPSFRSASPRSKGPRPLSRQVSARTPSPSGFNADDLLPIHSNPFARPEAPNSEAEFQWGDDAASTIAPDDSVSQLDRRFTGKRTLNGPRALPSSHLATPVVPEDDDNGSYGWVDPAGLGPEDDASTIVGPTGRAIPQGRAPPAAQQYYSTVEEEMDREEDVAAYRSSANLRSSSSAGLPLVRDAAPMAGGFDPSTSNVGSGVKPYQGYAAVAKGEDSDEEPPYGAYSRSGDADLERAMRDGTAGDRDGSAVGGIKSNFASAFAGSLSYVKSLRSTPTSMNKDQFDGPTDEYGYDGESTYPPQQLNKGYSSERAVDVSNMEPAPWHQRLLWDTTPNELRILEHKRGLGVQARPWACWILSVIMVAVLIYELVHMAQLTGSPIQTKPSFNVMIGPSGAVLINVGARFAGCIKYIANVTDISWICLADSNTASASLTSADATCTMSTICGFGGFPTNEPNQSFRFVVPIFLHAGIIHIALNLIAQCVSSAQVERQMGTPKFLLLYFPSGIFGFVLGANFALVGQPSVGASGAIFGTHAAILVDLIAHWNIEYQPKRKLFYLLLEIIVGLALGLVPGVDNFAHIGGFAIGLLMSILLFPIIHETKRHRIVFIVLRCIAGPVIIVLFVVLIKNFYDSDPAAACEWCRYLSCWPTANNNHCKGTGLETSSTSSVYFGSLVAFLVTFVPSLL